MLLQVSPLAGDDVFNDGAGMSRTTKATRFVYGNMPLGAGVKMSSLTVRLGVKLFDGDSNAIIPTVYGKALLRRAQAIIASTEEFEREIRLIQGLEVWRSGASPLH